MWEKKLSRKVVKLFFMYMLFLELGLRQIEIIVH